MAWATPIGPASSNTEEALAVTLPRLRETGRSGEQAAEVLEAYLEPRRLAAVDDELLGSLADHTDLYALYNTDKAFKAWLQERLFAAAPDPEVIVLDQ